MQIWTAYGNRLASITKHFYIAVRPETTRDDVYDALRVPRQVFHRAARVDRREMSCCACNWRSGMIVSGGQTRRLPRTKAGNSISVLARRPDPNEFGANGRRPKDSGTAKVVLFTLQTEEARRSIPPDVGFVDEFWQLQPSEMGVKYLGRNADA